MAQVFKMLMYRASIIFFFLDTVQIAKVNKAELLTENKKNLILLFFALKQTTSRIQTDPLISPSIESFYVCVCSFPWVLSEDFSEMSCLGSP